jgi:hypothetical protein
MNRRDFLSCFGLTVGSFFIPAFVARQIRDTCVLQRQPLIATPSSFHDTVIYAVSDAEGYILHYGDPDVEPAVPTWREFAYDHGWCVDRDEQRVAFLERFCGYDPREKVEKRDEDLGQDEDEDFSDEPYIPWDEPITDGVLDYYLEWDYVRTESPQFLAYSYLSDLPLCDSPERFKGDPLGRLNFVEGDAPGSNLTYVSAPNLATIACLQHRLNELDTGVLIEVQ